MAIRYLIDLKIQDYKNNHFLIIDAFLLTHLHNIEIEYNNTPYYKIITNYNFKICIFVLLFNNYVCLGLPVNMLACPLPICLTYKYIFLSKCWPVYIIHIYVMSVFLNVYLPIDLSIASLLIFMLAITTLFKTCK